MFTVKKPEEVQEILREAVVFSSGEETVPLADASGRVLARPVLSREYVPDFQRSTVDGYAVKASDTFGCSEGLPALLIKTGEVLMGKPAGFAVRPGECAYVPTGGEVPEGADAVAMIEYSEDYGEGTIGILRPCAPGENVIFRGDDLKPGQEVLPAGIRLRAAAVGALASMGVTAVPVRKKVRVGILSTGDELIPAGQDPAPGQIRDVNSALLGALVQEAGAQAVQYGIIPDRKEALQEVFGRAVEACDLVLISGGSSVGARDLTCQIIEENGSVLFHGISMKPGKPTIFGLARKKSRDGARGQTGTEPGGALPEDQIQTGTKPVGAESEEPGQAVGTGLSETKHEEQGKEGTMVPVFGLPGHPGAAFFVAEIFLRPLLERYAGLPPAAEVKAVLRENLSANHGRAQYMAAVLERDTDTDTDMDTNTDTDTDTDTDADTDTDTDTNTDTDGYTVYARPVYMKSGMITGIAAADGYFCVPGDTEGLPAGAGVTVIEFG